MKVVSVIMILALVGCANLSARSDPADPTAYRHPRHRHAPPVDKKKKPALAIEISVEKELGIARYVHRIDDETVKDHGAGLTGTIRVTLQNISDHDLVLEDLGIHNLVFEKRYNREEYVIVHEGICSLMCRGDPNVVRHIALDPAESRTLRFRTWGYSNAWEMHPPPGRYHLGYRIRELSMERRLMPGCSSPSMTKVERVAVCKRNLQDEGYWHEAFEGQRLKVQLGPTKPHWLP